MIPYSLNRRKLRSRRDEGKGARLSSAGQFEAF